MDKPQPLPACRTPEFHPVDQEVSKTISSKSRSAFQQVFGALESCIACTRKKNTIPSKLLSSVIDVEVQTIAGIIIGSVEKIINVRKLNSLVKGILKLTSCASKDFVNIILALIKCLVGIKPGKITLCICNEQACGCRGPTVHTQVDSGKHGSKCAAIRLRDIAEIHLVVRDEIAACNKELYGSVENAIDEKCKVIYFSLYCLIIIIDFRGNLIYRLALAQQTKVIPQ